MTKKIMSIKSAKPKISIVLPCLNEEKGLSFCLKEIKKVIEKNKIEAEIIVVDNGSTDKSVKTAEEKGAIVFFEPKKGYGSACLKGIEKSRGEYVLIADSDASYDFSNIPLFLNFLYQGYDFVIGNRFKGKIEKGAMKWSHRYIGNPILSFLMRIFFGVKIKDSHCGMRAFKKNVLTALNLRTGGMEFASEMIIKAARNKLKIKEIPVNYRKRKGRSKLHSLRDGWKHFRFMLLWSPLFLFLIPGLFLFCLGLFSMIWLYFDSFRIFGIKFFYHPMFLSALFIIIGYQLIIFSLFAKTYAIVHLKEKSRLMDKIFHYLTIEKAGFSGIFISLIGFLIYSIIFLKWLKSGFGNLNEIKNSILALTFIVLGIQTIFSSFMLSILSIKEK